MSPEQAAGDLDGLGPRSDVYSLGATLYCLLTGRPPFEGDDVGEILRKVQAGDFRPPREVDPALDKALEAVCTKAMARKPEDRYAGCRGLADDVERWMADEVVTAYPEPRSRTLVRWLTRHRTGVTGLAAAVLAGVVGLAAVLLVQTRANTRLSASLDGEMKANAKLIDEQAKVEARNKALAAEQAKATRAQGVAQAERQQAVTNLYHARVEEAAALRRAGAWATGRRSSTGSSKRSSSIRPTKTSTGSVRKPSPAWETLPVWNRSPTKTSPRGSRAWPSRQMEK